MTARAWALAAAASVTLLALVGALGESAATPGLGPRTALPPWDLAAGAPAWLVTVLLVVAYLLGAAAVVAGLRALAGGWRPAVVPAVAAAAVAVAALAVVPPVGSADHLSYVAYGRIAAAGDDPYVVVPLTWRGGHDPVAGAVAPPWQRTPSVYGPVATGAQAAVAAGGHGSLRLTVWLWQLLSAAAFGLVAWLLDRLCRRTDGDGDGGDDDDDGDARRRGRVLVLWTLNPLLLGQLVLGAHVDVLAAAFGVAGLAAALHGPSGRARGGTAGWAAAAGALLAAAVATKPPYGLLALAALWAVRHRPRRELAVTIAAGAAGGLAVVVPGYLWAGPHAFDQLRAASRFTSLATPWRAVVNLGDAVLGHGALAPFVAPAALLLAALLAVPLARRLGAARRPGGGDDELGAAASAALVLTTAWVLTAPYALPWYDAMVWAPLALVGATALDPLLLARFLVLALAYVPGRVVGLTPTVSDLTLGARTFVAPVLVLAVLVAVARWALSGGSSPVPPGAPHARGPRPRRALPPAR